VRLERVYHKELGRAGVFLDAAHGASAVGDHGAAAEELTSAREAIDRAAEALAKLRAEATSVGGRP
jgi:enolase